MRPFVLLAALAAAPAVAQSERVGVAVEHVTGGFVFSGDRAELRARVRGGGACLDDLDPRDLQRAAARLQRGLSRLSRSSHRPSVRLTLVGRAPERSDDRCPDEPPLAVDPKLQARFGEVAAARLQAGQELLVRVWPTDLGPAPVLDASMVQWNEPTASPAFELILEAPAALVRPEAPLRSPAPAPAPRAHWSRDLRGPLYGVAAASGAVGLTLHIDGRADHERRRDDPQTLSDYGARRSAIETRLEAADVLLVSAATAAASAVLIELFTEPPPPVDTHWTRELRWPLAFASAATLGAGLTVGALAEEEAEALSRQAMGRADYLERRAALDDRVLAADVLLGTALITATSALVIELLTSPERPGPWAARREVVP